MAPIALPRRLTKGVVFVTATALLLCAATLGAARLAAGGRERTLRVLLAPAEGRLVPAADVRLFVQEAGPEQGRAVVLVHGTGAWGEIWRPVMESLSERGYRVIAVDLPPFGFSDRPPSPDYSPATQARRLWAALDALEVERVILVGHSFGARTTVAAALSHPARVERLVLVDAALGLTPPADTSRPAPSVLVRALLAAPPVRNAVVASTITNPWMTRTLMRGLVAHPERLTEAQLAMLRRPMRQPGTTNAYGAWLPGFVLDASPAPAATRRALASFPAPTHVIWGALDSLTSPQQGRDLVQLVPCASWDLLPGVGHIPGLEAPAQLAAALRTRLDASPSCGPPAAH